MNNASNLEMYNTPANFAGVIIKRDLKSSEMKDFLDWAFKYDFSFIHPKSRGDYKHFYLDTLKCIHHQKDKRILADEKPLLEKDLKRAGIQGSTQELCELEPDRYQYLKELRLRAKYFNKTRHVQTTARRIFKSLSIERRSNQLVAELSDAFRALGLELKHNGNSCDLKTVGLDEQILAVYSYESENPLPVITEDRSFRFRESLNPVLVATGLELLSSGEDLDPLFERIKSIVDTYGDVGINLNFYQFDLTEDELFYEGLIIKDEEVVEIGSTTELVELNNLPVESNNNDSEEKGFNPPLPFSPSSMDPLRLTDQEIEELPELDRRLTAKKTERNRKDFEGFAGHARTRIDKHYCLLFSNGLLIASYNSKTDEIFLFSHLLSVPQYSWDDFSWRIRHVREFIGQVRCMKKAPKTKEIGLLDRLYFVDLDNYANVHKNLTTYLDDIE